MNWARFIRVYRERYDYTVTFGKMIAFEMSSDAHMPNGVNMCIELPTGSNQGKLVRIPQLPSGTIRGIVNRIQEMFDVLFDSTSLTGNWEQHLKGLIHYTIQMRISKWYDQLDDDMQLRIGELYVKMIQLATSRYQLTTTMAIKIAEQKYRTNQGEFNSNLGNHIDVMA